MIKIERVSPKAVVTVDGNTVGLGYMFDPELLDTLEVKNGEVLYSVNEKNLKYKWSEGEEGASRPKAVASVVTKEIKVAAPAPVVEKASAKPIETLDEDTSAKPIETISPADVGSVEDVLLEEGYSAVKTKLKQPVVDTTPRKAIPGK